MTHFTTLITLGAIVAILPLSGLPVQWEQWTTVALGALIAFIAWRGRRQYRTTHARRRPEAFAENGEQHAHESAGAGTTHEDDA